MIYLFCFVLFLRDIVQLLNINKDGTVLNNNVLQILAQLILALVSSAGCIQTTKLQPNAR